MAVSVYISNQHIDVAVGSAGKVNIKKMYRLPVSEGTMINGIIMNEPQLKEDLEKLWETYKLPKRNICLIIDSGKIMSKVISVPYMKDSELIRFISMEFSDADRGEQVFDYFPFPGKKPYELNQVFCAAIEKSVIDSYIALFTALKLKISRINIGIACLIKYALATGLFEGKTGILMQLEGNNVYSLLFENGTYIYSRRSRLFNEKGTVQSVEELEQIVLGIRQFHSQRHSEYNIQYVYKAGFEDTDTGDLDVRLNTAGIELKDMVGSSQYKIPETVTTENGEKRTVQTSFLYVTGNML